MRTVQVKVKGLQLVNGIWRSRKVLPPEVAAILGKSELTRTTGVAGEKDDMVSLAKARDVAVREDHQGEFKRIIAEAREEAKSPYNRLLKADPNARHLDMEEISERAAELGICDDLYVAHVPKSPFEKLLDAEPSLRKAELHEITARLTELGHTNAAKEPVPFAVLLAAWELENTNKRTRRTKRHYMARFAEHLGHDDATQVEPSDFAAFKEKLLKQANAGEIAHKSVENHIAGVKAVFKAAVQAHKIAKNPCDGISFQAKRSQMVKTLGYSIEQVAMILREGRNQPPHIRYPTLIAGFSGARVGEIADATTYDVYVFGDMYVLDIRIDYRAEGQEIKNEMSIRKFPLHPQIIAEGFIKYWLSLPPGPLFPAFSLGHDNRRGDAASREISEWIRDDLGIRDPSPKLRYKPNHSFRNYVKTQWRNAKIEQETHDAITGHGSGKDESRNYGEYELKLMLRPSKSFRIRSSKGMGISLKRSPTDPATLLPKLSSRESRDRSSFHIVADGNPHKIPRMGTLSGIGHPPFSYPFHDGNIIGHTRGPGPASLNSGYGSTHRSINCGVPFWKGIGLFLAGRSGSGMERSKRRAAVKSRNSLAGTASTRDQPCRTRSRRRFRRGFTAGRAALGDSTALIIPVLENPPIPGSVKAKGFSRFLGRIIAVLLSVVGVRETIA